WPSRSRCRMAGMSGSRSPIEDGHGGMPWGTAQFGSGASRMDGGRASTGDDGVTRWQHEGRVFRWQRAGSAWPGHVAFVALRAGEVVLGDRYAGEGVERTYTCEPQALLEGC